MISLVAALALVTGTSPAQASPRDRVPDAQVGGAVTGPGQSYDAQGPEYNSYVRPLLSELGYKQDEYFFSGTARSYARIGGAYGTDGKWSVAPAATAPYRSRMIVRRPADPRRFNGTVLVEWLNVTTGADLATDFSYTFEELARQGYIYVGVDAQAAGITTPGTGLKAWNPARYGSLSHPGDEYSYDIFAQAGQAVRDHPGLLGGRRASVVLASGHSQSAMRLVTYINALSTTDHVYDGYMVHSRASFSAPIGGQPVPLGAHIRTDTDVPVLDVQHEGDTVGTLNSHIARQDDSRAFRLWEVAGGAHDDAYGLEFGGRIPRSYAPCTVPPDRGDTYQAVNAALSRLTRWAAYGIAPPHAPRLEINPAGTDVVRDSYGNAAGGIRLPFLEVPTASYNGIGNQDCGGWYHGSSVPFDAATLKALYPTHGRYVADVTRAAARAAGQGFLLPADARIDRIKAAQSDIGR